ncbi:MAG: tetratricopeptide repeat protein [Nitrospirae bacterium]|nr:tetratricopeptide repeat protein [Nitrospirota bacterium]
MKSVKLFLAILLCSAVFIPPAYAEEEKVIVRLPEFIIFSEEQLQEEPVKRPEKAAPFKDLKGLKEEVQAPDSETTINAEAKEKLKKTTPSQMTTGWVHGNSVALFLMRITGEEPPDEAIFKSALYFFKNEDYKKAIDAFKKTIKKYPKSDYVPAAAYWIAESYYAMGRRDEAIAVYEDIIGKYPVSDYWDYAHYSLGWLYVNEGDYKKAIRYFTKATQSPVSNLAYSAQFWVGDCLMRLKRYEDAIKTFNTLSYPTVTSDLLKEDVFFDGVEKLLAGKVTYREFISRFPFPESLIINTAMYGLGIAGGGIETAGVSFQKGGMKGIKDVTWGIRVNTDMKYLEAAVYRTALAYIALNKMDKAREEARRLKGIDPQTLFSDFIELEVGLYYYKRKDITAALKIFQGLSMGTLQKEIVPIAEFMIGEILYKEGRLIDALSSYEKAERNEERPILGNIASYKAAVILYQRKDYKRVLERLQPLKNKRSLIRYKDDINYMIAESLTGIEKYDEALSHYQAIPNASPLAEKVQYGRAWVYYKKGMWKEAAEAFNVFLDRYHQSPLREDALFRIADSYLNLKDFKGYYNTYAQFLREYPKSGLNAEIAFQAGLSLYRVEKFDDAANIFRNIITTAPRSKEAEEASFRLGWTYFRMNDYKRAISEFNSHVTNHPKSKYITEALLKIGDSYYNLKEYPRALEYYNNIKAKYPNSSQSKDAEYGAILAYKQLGNSEAAMSEAEGFVKKNPKMTMSLTLQFQMAEELEAKKKMGEALIAYRKALALSETSEFADVALYRIGRILFEGRELHNAISELNRLISQYPKSTYAADSRYKIAEAFFLLGEYEQAIGKYKDFISLYSENPNTSEAMLKIAQSYDKAKKGDDAIKAYNEFIKRFPHHKMVPAVYLALGRHYYDKMDKKSAAGAYQKATDLPDDEMAAEAQFRLAELALSEGRNDDAKIEFMKVYYLYPDIDKWASLSQLKTAEIYEKEKKAETAFALYQRIMDKAKSKEDVKKASDAAKNIGGTINR